MKKAIAIVLAIMSMSALCAPIRSVLGAQGAINKVDSSEGQKNPYVTRELVAMWDGEWNIGFNEHDPNATVWKDLANHGYDLDLTSAKATIEDNHVFLNKSSFTLTTPADQQSAHIEVVVSDVSASGWYQWFIGIGNSRIGSAHPDYVGSLCTKSVYTYNNAMFTDGMSLLYNSAEGYWIKLVDGITSLSYPCIRKTFSANYSLYVNNKNYDFRRVSGNSPVSSLDSPLIVGGDTVQCRFYCIRIYDRNLTDKERLHNYLVDKERFGL